MILDELAEYARVRVDKAKTQISYDAIKAQALALQKKNHAFKKALSCDGMSFICEVKKASPSKGVIDPIFNYLDIAKSYEVAGANCISCLTEPKWFLGSDQIFSQIREAVSIPMIRKDFTVDEYQIYEAMLLGADAILIICSLHNQSTIEHYLDICNTLGIDALVETHNAEEIKMALDAGAQIIGVNNRNLKDFSMNLNNATSLRDLVPSDKIFVAESGIKTKEDISLLYKSGVDAVLIGETLMRSEDKKAMLDEFRSGCSIG